MFVAIHNIQIVRNVRKDSGLRRNDIANDGQRHYKAIASPKPLAFPNPPPTPTPMHPRPLLVLPLLLLATPALAARTATISGEPTAHASPDAGAAVTGHPPNGATVTVERCTSDATQGTAPGTQHSALGTSDWCLLRGVGWVMGHGLVNLSADPTTLLPDDGGFDPLKPTTPAWDDLDSSSDEAPAQLSF